MAPPEKQNAVYVVTGANRGIGLGLVKALLGRPSTAVIATVRNDKAVATLESDLVGITKGDGSTMHIVQLDLEAALTPEQVRSAFPVLDHVDVLINNAGMATPMTLATETSAQDLSKTFQVNVIGSLTAFQGLWPLMKKSAAPKLVNMTSSVGCILSQELPGGAYGPSKAALNWLSRALHLQNEGLITLALHPGWVQTNMGIACARDWGYPGTPPETVEGSAQGLLTVIDGATKDSLSGKFVTYKGQILNW